MRRPIIWLLALSVVAASLLSTNQCPIAGHGMAADGHENLWHNGAGDKLFHTSAIWRSHTRAPALPQWRAWRVTHEGVLPHTSASITPATPPPRRLA